MTLSVKDCIATATSIRISFSEDVNHASSSNAAAYGSSAINPGNYSVDTIPPANQPRPLGGKAEIFYDPSRFLVHIKPSGNGDLTQWPWAYLVPGNWVAITVSGVSAATGPDDKITSKTLPTRVDGHEASQTTRAVTDAVAFPVLTEEVGFAPSPLAKPSGAPAGGGGSTSLGQTVTKAVSDVLGWKIKPNDPKGFVGALTASFTCADVEGHTQCTWTPRTYAVQTDLSGGITGAQASLYSRAQDTLKQALPLLDGLYPLDPEADAENIAALKGLVRSQLTELVSELGLAGGPRVSRINQYFQLLLLDTPPFPPPQFDTEPDHLGGTLGSLRDQLGLKFSQDFVNTLEDEQDLTNFRILSDYITSLAQSWINNLGFFGLDTQTPFFGTQLVLLSRQLSVVAESVDEVRFTLDSVFIGPAERQTLKLQFGPTDQPLFAEDLFNWIQNFATEEGPRLIQDGGKFGVRNTFLPIAEQLQHLIETVQAPNPLNNGLPPGFHTFRVQRSLKQLGEELAELASLARPIKHDIDEEPTTKELNEIKTLVLPPRGKLIAFPPQLDFGDQVLNSPDFVLPVTLFNAGNISVTISRAQLAGQKDDFSFQPDLTNLTIPAAETLAIQIAFSPKGSVGSRSASLDVTYNGLTLSPSTVSVSLKGNARQIGVPGGTGTAGQAGATTAPGGRNHP
jgi:hypothetical protein